MFTKEKTIGAITKTVIDWEAICWTIIIGFFALGILGNLIGS